MRKSTFKLLTKLPTKYITNGVILVVLLFTYGIVGSYFIMGLNLIDSIYFSVVTMAGVGYGDYVPTTGIQKIFSTILALGGVVLLAYVFNIILTNFQKRMSEYSKGARKMRRIKKMDSYYILCGYGRVGKVVLQELKERNQNVILFEKDSEMTADVVEDENLVIINKDATEDNLISTLADDPCKSVIISTGSDVTNLFIVLTIRETNPDAWIVTRASKLENVTRLRKAGADKIVSPEVIGGKNLYFESAKPHDLRITVQHSSDDIYNEFKIIMKHGCSLENIDYHIPGIETPLNREIRTMSIEAGEKYVKYLETHEEAKEALDNLYNSVNNVHSHFISGPDRATFEKLIKELEKHETIIGINLTNKEIMEKTKKIELESKTL